MISEQLQNRICDLSGSILALKASKTKGTALLEDVKYCLNQIFSGVVAQVIYTENSDKPFFGLVVMPVIPGKDIIDIFMKNEQYVINKIYVEFDSKLFSELLDLTNDEITALLIREVGHMVSDSTPIQKVKADIDDYLYQRNETIKISDCVHYVELLSYGVRDAIRKTISVFEAEKEDQIDQFDIDCEIDADLKDAMSKIDDHGYNPNSDIDNKLIFLSWVLRLYRDVLTYRIDSIHDLKESMQLTASQLEIKEMNNIIRRLERIDDDSLLTESSFLDNILQVFKDNSKKMKIMGIQRYEDDYYQLQFEVNNLETQDDAILILHQINSRMAVIDDFLTSEEVDKNTYAKWSALYRNFNELRNSVAKNRLYQNKTRLYVNYGMDD